MGTACARVRPRPRCGSRAALTQRLRPQSGKTQLGGAACASWLHLAKLLIERGAQVDASDAVRAESRAQKAFGRAGLMRRCDVRWPPALQDLNSPLHDAAASGDAGIVAMLLSAGANVEARAAVRVAARAVPRSGSLP